MTRDGVTADLKLIVRALHRDVSALDQRLRMLEEEMRVLREGHQAPDLVVVSRDEARGA